LHPGRRLAAPVIDGLVRRGEREQLRLTELARGAVVERGVGQLLEAGVLEDVVDQVAASPLPGRVAEDVFAERLVAAALASPSLSRVVDQVLASPELARVVAHIARSQEVRDALTAQPAGLADELAGAVRSRTAVADDAAERVAWRLLRRKSVGRDEIAPEPG
jgi:hypothetical protein